MKMMWCDSIKHRIIFLKQADCWEAATLISYFACILPYKQHRQFAFLLSPPSLPCSSVDLRALVSMELEVDKIPWLPHLRSGRK